MIYTKLIFSLAIFVTALFAGLVPLWRQPGRLFFKKSEALVSGVFLGVAFFHLLPDASKMLHSGHGQHVFTLPYLLAAISFFLFLGIARVDKLVKQNILPWLVFFILSFHSLISGLALGLIHVDSMLWILFIAIIAHKAFDSFALLVVLKKYHVNLDYIYWFIVLFAWMTPVGIYIGSMTFHSLNGTTADLVTGYFNAIAAGSFIYVGLSEGLLYSWLVHKEKITSLEITLMLIGFFAMAVLSLWV